MKGLEQTFLESRYRLRSLRSKIPLLSRGVRPVRVVIFLGDAPPVTPSVDVERFDRSEWRDAVVALVDWLGPVRFCIDATGQQEMDEALELVRMAHRLDCPTHLIATGPVAPEEALEFVDRGLGAVTIRVAGLDERTQQAVLGTSLDAAATSLHAFVEARSNRGRKLAIHVNIPADAENLQSLKSVAGWVRQAGADETSLGLLLGRVAPDGLLEELESVFDLNVPTRLSGFVQNIRQSRSAPRACLLWDGSFFSSMMLPAMGNLREADPKALWANNAKLVQDAIRHERPFDEVELFPTMLRTLR